MVGNYRIIFVECSERQASIGKRVEIPLIGSENQTAWPTLLLVHTSAGLHPTRADGR